MRLTRPCRGPARVGGWLNPSSVPSLMHSSKACDRAQRRLVWCLDSGQASCLYWKRTEKKELGVEWNRGLQAASPREEQGCAGRAAQTGPQSGPESVPGPLPTRLTSQAPACSWGTCVWWPSDLVRSTASLRCDVPGCSGRDLAASSKQQGCFHTGGAALVTAPAQDLPPTPHLSPTPDPQPHPQPYLIPFFRLSPFLPA